MVVRKRWNQHSWRDARKRVNLDRSKGVKGGETRVSVATKVIDGNDRVKYLSDKSSMDDDVSTLKCRDVNDQIKASRLQ